MRFLALLLCVAPATASAGEIRVGAGFGYTRHMRGGDLDGVGGNVYVGRPFASGLVLEGQVGVHHNWHESNPFDAIGAEQATTRLELTTVPLLIGGRYQFDVGALIVPYVGTHVGVAVVRSSGALGNLRAKPEVAVDFAFNVGAGVDLVAGEAWAVGFGVWYWMVLAGETERVAGVDITKQHDSLVSLTLHLRFDL